MTIHFSMVAPSKASDKAINCMSYLSYMYKSTSPLYWTSVNINIDNNWHLSMSGSAHTSHSYNKHGLQLSSLYNWYSYNLKYPAHMTNVQNSTCNLVIWVSQNYGCWCPGATSYQAISDYDVDSNCDHKPNFCLGYHTAEYLFQITIINTLRPRQNGHRFADNTFKRIFLNENVIIWIKISLKFVPKGPIKNNPAPAQIMAWRRQGNKPLSEPMMVNLPMHICLTRPQWVK